MRKRRRFRALSAACLALLSCSTVAAADAGAAVYWGGGGFVGAANLDGSMALISYPDEIADQVSAVGVCGVAVDATHLYWADSSNGAIGEMALVDYPGRLPGPYVPPWIDQSIVGGLSDPCGVAVDSSHLYWADEHAIGRANLDGSARQPNFIPGLARACGVAVDSQHVYWGDPVEDSIGRARLDGGEPEPEFIPAAANPCGIAVDGSHLYWTSYFPDSIGRANLDGSEADQSFIPLGAAPCGVAVAAGQIYWAIRNKTGSLLGVAALDGSGARVLVSDDYQASCGVATDARIFTPPPPRPSDYLRFGKLRREKGKQALLLRIDVPARGDLTVDSPGIGWSVDKGNPPPYVGGTFTWKLRLWPGHGATAKRIRRQLREKGRAPFTLRVTYQQEGRLPIEASKQLAFLDHGANPR